MRVVWKDSNAKGHKPVKYRGYFAEGFNGGWAINIPGDDNIYRTHYCALNAIDKYLGGTGQMGGAKRSSYGIQIIGKLEDKMRFGS
jgi:hypothetical protein